MASSRAPYARANAGVAQMKSTPGPYCGGNSPGAASTPDDAQHHTDRLARGAEQHQQAVRNPTRSCGAACVTVNETSTSSGSPASGRRPASSFLCHIVPGIASFSGAASVADAGWSTV